MFQVAVVLLVSISSVSGISWNRPNHWGNPCYLCKCFVEYTDRDVTMPLRPYAMAFDAYDSTEDRCLATCLRDSRCKAAVYGMVGGRKVFTCEFYEEIDAKNHPMYKAFTNIYYKKVKCDLSHVHLPSVEMIEADDSSAKRRAKHMKMMTRNNPFNGK